MSRLRTAGNMTEREIKYRLEHLTEHDAALAARGVPAPGDVSRIRIFSPGWSSGCTGCERNNRLCVREVADCPDDVATMKLVAERLQSVGAL